MKVLAEIVLTVFHQAHQAVGTRHGIGTIVEIVVIGQMVAVGVGERNSLKHTSWNVGTGFIGSFKC